MIIVKVNNPAVDQIYKTSPDTVFFLFFLCYLITHSSPTIPEAASSRSSVKDTLFLSNAESERTEVGRGGVPALGTEL